MFSTKEAAQIVIENELKTEKQCYQYIRNNYIKYNIDSIKQAKNYAGSLVLIVNSDYSPQKIIKHMSRRNQNFVVEADT